MWPLVAPLPPSSNNANTSSTAAASSQTGGATGGILPHHPPMPLPPYHHHHPHHHMIPPPCVPPPFHPMGMPPPHLKYHPHHHSGASSSQQQLQQGQGGGPHHPLLPPPPPPGLPLVGAGGTGQQQGNMYQNSFNHLPPGIPPPMPLVTGGANLNNSNSLNAPNARINNNGNMTAGGTNLNNHNNILLQGSMGAGHQGMLMNTNNQHHHHGMSVGGNLLLNNNSNPNNFTNNNLNHSSKFGVKNGLWAHNNLPNLLPGATPGNSDSAAFWNSNHNATAVSSSANLGINGGGGAFGKKFDSFSNMVTNGSHITNQQHHNTNSSLSSMFNMGALLGDNIESIWKNTSDNSLTSNINNVNDDCNNNSSAGFNPFPPPKTLGSKGSIGNFDNSHNINYNNFNTQSSTSVIQNNNNYNNTKNANNATLNKMGDMTTNSFFGGRDGTSAFDYKSTPSGSSSLLSGFENRLFPPYNNTFNGNSSETGNINAQSFDDVFSPSLDGTNMNDSIMGGGLVNKVSSNYPNTGNNYDKWNSIGSGFRGDATQNSASHTPSNASTNKSFSSAIVGSAMAEPMTKMKATAVSDDDRDITGTSLWAANANASSNNKSNTSEFLGLRSGSSGLSSAHFGENFGNPNISNNNISNNNCNNMNNGNQVEDRFTKQPRIPTASDDTFSHQLPQQTIYPTDITNLNANTNTPNNVNSFDSNTNTNVMEKSKETGGGVNDELIRQFINTTNGWGRIPIKQDTSWDMCGDDEETLTFASGPTTAVRNMGSSSCINTSSTAVCSFDPNTLGTNLWKSQNDSNSMMMAPQNTVGSVNFMLNQQMSANINNSSSLNPNMGGFQPNGMDSFNATNVNVNAKSNSDNFSSNISSPRSAGGSSSFMYNNTNNNNGNSNQNENETANYWFSGGGGTSTLTKDANSDTRLPMLRQLSSSTGSSLSNNTNNASNFFHLPSSSSTHQQTFPYNNNNSNNNHQNGNIGSESSNNNNYSSTTSANPNNGNYNGGTKMNDYYNGNGTLVRGTSNFTNTNNTNNVNNAENDEDEDGEDGGIGVWKSVEAAKQETSMYWNPNLINDMANGESLSVLDNVPHSTTLNNRNVNSHYNAANYGGKLSSNLIDFHRSNNNNNTYNHNNEPTIPMNSHEGVFPMYPPSNQNNANINNNNNIYANTIQSSNPRNIENNSLTSELMLIQNHQKLNASVNNMIPALKKSYSSLLNNGNSSNLSSLNQNYNSALGSTNFVHNNNNPIINSNDASYYNKENAASHMNNSTTIYNTNNFLSGTTTFNKTNMMPAPSLLFNNNNKSSVAEHHANPPMPEIDDGTDIWARNVVNNNANIGGNNANFMMEQHQHSNKFLAAGNSHPHNATNGNKFNSNNPPLSMNHFGNNHSINGFNKHCNNMDVNMFQYHNQNERNSTFNSTTEFEPLINNNVFGNPAGNGINNNNNITNNARIGPLFSTNKPQTTQNFMSQNAFVPMQQKTSLQNNFQNTGESSLLSNSTNTVILSNGSISTPTAPHNRNANEMSTMNNNVTKIAPSTHFLTNCSTPNMVTAKNTNNLSNSTNNSTNNTSSSSTNSYNNNGKEDMAKLIPILSTKLSREALELLASQNAAFFEEFLHECLKLIHGNGNGNGNSQNSNTDSANNWANRINVQTLQAILIELVMKKRKQQLIANNNNNTSSSVVGQGHNQMSATGCGADILASANNNNNNNSATNQHE